MSAVPVPAFATVPVSVPAVATVSVPALSTVPVPAFPPVPAVSLVLAFLSLAFQLLEVLVHKGTGAGCFGGIVTLLVFDKVLGDLQVCVFFCHNGGRVSCG